MLKAVLVIIFFQSLIISSAFSAEISHNEIRIRIAPNVDHQEVFDDLGRFMKISKVNSLLVDKTYLDQKIISATGSFEKYRTAEVLNRTYRIQYNDIIRPEYFIKKIKKEIPKIEIVEAVRYPELQSKEDYNDPMIDELSRLDQIQAYEAWEYSDGDTSIVIGISDAGFLPIHEDLQGNLAKFWGEIPNNQVDDDGNGYIDDFDQFNLVPNELGSNWGNTFSTSDHGTRCAGIIGAEANNGIGILGVGNKCRIFPIKMAPYGTEQLTHAYESIVFAADRGINILNCSWGIAGEFSGIEQSVIDYAVARNMLIVSSAGNVDFSNVDEERIRAFYPSAYRGVLSVGSVSKNDIVAGSSSLGVHSKIMAQGVSNLTTINQVSGYNDRESGTSFASPVVAGAAGILLSRYPWLNNPFQLIAILRQSGDDISNINANIKDFVPKRLNLLKAMQTSLDGPGLDINNVKYFDSQDLEKKRFLENEDVRPEIMLDNFLGGQGELTYTLSVGLDLNNGSIELIDSVMTLVLQSDMKKILLNDFKFKMVKDASRPIIFRIDITGQSFSDFLLFEFLPNPPIGRFENENLAFTIGDNGRFGYYDEDQYYGIGFMNRSHSNWFWEGGLFAVTDDKLSSVSGSSRFAVDKSFSGNEPNTSIISGVGGSGTELIIEQKVEMPKSKPYAAINFKVTTNNPPLSNIGLAYELDWDIGTGYDDYKYNASELIEENINSTLIEQNAAVQISYDSSASYFIGLGVISKDPNDKAVSAGGESFDFKLLSYGQTMDLFNSGKSLQIENLEDIGNVIGILFNEGLDSDTDELECKVCLSATASREEAIRNIEECLLGSNSIEENQMLDLRYSNGILYLHSKVNNTSIHIYDTLGKEIYSRSSFTGELLHVDLNGGVYFLKIGNTSMFKFLVDHSK